MSELEGIPGVLSIDGINYRTVLTSRCREARLGRYHPYFFGDSTLQTRGNLESTIRFHCQVATCLLSLYLVGYRVIEARDVKYLLIRQLEQ